jgi:hypothetical protein
LWNIVQPIAEGLDRAHRVGVLHRDIKPPNILINEDGRPVLIDFGSARFEAAEATSTKVTFHTPPYAAIEQYVKTYDQGPWTDIYALGVVLYECITGEKPPEVLERLHGSAGSSLAEGHWPGFSKRFLQAVDAAMTIKPTERPQSIREWLAMFGKPEPAVETGAEDEPTRFFAHEVAAEEIVPVPPPAPGFNPKDSVETRVPADPSEVQFKRVGEETGASKKRKGAAGKAAVPAAAEEETPPEAPDEEVAVVAAKKKPAKAPREGGRSPLQEWLKTPRNAMLAGGGAVALLAAIAAGSMMLAGGNPDRVEAGYEPVPDLSGPSTTGIDASAVSGLAAAARALAEDARTAGAPETAVNSLVAAGVQLDKQSAELPPLLNDPAQAAAATALTGTMKQTATAANVEFANALLRDAEARARRLSNGVPPSSRTRLAAALSGLQSAVEAARTTADPAQSLIAARDVLGKAQAFAYSLQAASNQRATDALAEAPAPAPKKVEVTTAAPRTPARTAATAKTPAATTTTSGAGVSAAKMAQFNAIVSEGRSLAKQVIRMGGRGSSATRVANATMAKNYDSYLKNLKDSMRGVKTDKEADRLIKQANQTKAYIVFLQKQSSQTP